MIVFELYSVLSNLWFEVEIPDNDKNRAWVMGTKTTRNIRFV